jgi:hypothetical protein
MAFAPAAWAVNGGYGPDGGETLGGVGALGDILVAKTVGPGGGTIVGRIGSTTLTVVVPRAAVAANDVVEVVSWTPNCAALKHASVVIGFAVLATDGSSRYSFARAPAEFVSSPWLTSNSPTVYVGNDGCTSAKLPVDSGTVWLPPEASPMFVVVAADPGTSKVSGGWFPHEFFSALLILLQGS